MPKRVFISYRREDTASSAGRVYDRLCQVLSAPSVFFDVTTVRGGENFEQKTLSEIERSDVVLVFIGKKWLEPPPQGGSARIWDPRDYVRAEVRAALDRPSLTLPVLVDGARMPAPELLPEDIRALSARNALPLRHESFDDDTEKIAATILGVAANKRLWEDKRRLGAKIGYSVVGSIVALCGLAAVALLHFWVLARPLSASIGESATTLLLIAAGFVGTGMGLAYEGRQRRRGQESQK